MKKQILIVHETGGQKYFEAITQLSRAGKIGAASYFESQVVRLFLSSTLRHRKPILTAAKQARRNICFRLRVPLLRGHIIVLGMAPWDIRLIWYRYLAVRNTVIYHTSWTQWDDNKVPKRYGPLDHMLRKIWTRFLLHPNVSAVAVTPASAAALRARTGKQACVIPHIVSKEFFVPRPRPPQRPFGLLFVGQLIPQKGILLLPEILDRCEPGTLLGIVGDGPMRDEIAKMTSRNTNVRYYGQVNQRNELADIVSRYDILLVPSLRTERWEELFGMVILEAMAAGLVVVASDHIGPRTILSDGKDGFLVEEGNIDQIAGVVNKLHGDHQIWQSISNAARCTALNYSPEAIGNEWLRVLNGLASTYREQREPQTESNA